VRAVGTEDGQRAIYAAVVQPTGSWSSGGAANHPPHRHAAGRLQPLRRLLPALYFERRQAELLNEVDETTLKRAERPFAQIDSQLRVSVS
jgi:hypothetical protein